MIPYFSFSIFHVLSYFRESLLPALSPSYRFPSDNNAGFLKSFDKYNDNLIKKTIQPKAVELASLWECSVTPIWLLIQCLLFRQNILMLIVYFQFLLFRYVTSLTTRASFAKIRAKGDQLLLPHLQSPSVLGKIANGYVSARNYLISFSEKFDVYFPEARRSSTSVHPHSQ
ncbi:hypothetical protein HMI54_002947 [Coelomomyces lativittatus]|nr:hypothetical protein HMI54_002947 [Coelomomyces lativittatus]